MREIKRIKPGWYRTNIAVAGMKPITWEFAAIDMGHAKRRVDQQVKQLQARKKTGVMPVYKTPKKESEWESRQGV